VAVVPGELSPQPVAQLSAALGVAGDAGRAGSSSTLWSGCVLFDATLGKLAAERLVDVVALLKFDVMGVDWGIRRGGMATEGPMLVQPPSTGVTLTAPGRDVAADAAFAGLNGQAGADESLPAVVLVQGDETLPRAGLFVELALVDEVNGLEVAWPLAFCVPCVMEGTGGVMSCP
jgi:hypothetical protein